RLRAAERPYGNLSRRRIRRELPAEDQDRNRGPDQDGRQGRGRHRRRGQDRTNRRRQDLRRPCRTDGAHPHRRNQRFSSVRGGEKMTLAKYLSSAVLALAALLIKLDPALAQEAADGAAEAAKPTIDSGDTAWMLTSTALVLMMTVPGL